MNRFFWTLSLCLGLGAAYSQTIYQFPLTNDLAAFEDRTIVLGTLSNESGETGNFGQVGVPPTTCSAADSARAYFFEDNAGLRFLNNRYIGCEYSISFTFKMDELSVRPGRTTDRVQLIEFGHNGQDRGIYLSVDEDTQGQATLSFWQLDGSGTGGSSIRVGAPLFFNTNDLYHLTLVRNCLDEVRIFINGERFGDPYADYNGVYYPSSASDTIYFFRDMPDLGLTEEASSGWIRNMVLADYEWTDQEISTRWDTFCQLLVDIDYEPNAGCKEVPTSFTITSDVAGLDSISWNFGDFASGANNTSTELSPDHTFRSAGSYTITTVQYFAGVRNIGTSTFIVNEPPEVSLGMDQTIIAGVSTLLQPTTPNQVTYQWSDGSDGSSLLVSQEGEYWVQARDVNTGCIARDTISITTRVITPGEVKERPLIVPNTFTPNGDGINDRWVIDGITTYANNKVSIYDRQGNWLLDLKDYKNDWDGATSGRTLTEGVYFYFIYSNDNLLRKGSISIIR